MDLFKKAQERAQALGFKEELDVTLSAQIVPRGGKDGKQQFKVVKYSSTKQNISWEHPGDHVVKKTFNGVAYLEYVPIILKLKPMQIAIYAGYKFISKDLILESQQSLSYSIGMEKKLIKGSSSNMFALVIDICEALSKVDIEISRVIQERYLGRVLNTLQIEFDSPYLDLNSGSNNEKSRELGKANV
jgi:hypothetical protein